MRPESANDLEFGFGLANAPVKDEPKGVSHVF
jgi:hypothetical protein